VRTRELIEALQEADPSGELHVFIHGQGRSPYAVSNLPHYYDGRECIVRPWHAEMATHDGSKVVIHSTDLETYMADKDNDSSDIKMPCGGCASCLAKIEAARFEPKAP
jgi:hypothetical protein